ncbi:MAG: DUF6316 family protein [Gammaproteobacteria bacterium]|nr:DUF6316 family protein [Gammaproteobacteria bacterium]
MKHRAGEHDNIPFRSERYFCSNGVWYFQTRGGRQVGPFIDKREMEAELLLFIREKAMAHNALTG